MQWQLTVEHCWTV